ncbi:MAG: S8 family serine peptidase [Methanosarcinales archaeon]|nr:S8 family serine peptidase [Methanosarcinales archaeon]
MKNTIIGLAVLIVLILIAVPASTQASDMVPVIIGFDDKPDKALVSAHGGAIKYEYSIIHAVSARLPAAAIENMKNAKGISFVEEDAVVYAIGKPTNKGKPDKSGEQPQPAQVIEWNMLTIQAPDAWTVSTGSGVKVAVIDTGIDKDHPDIIVAGGVSFADKNPFVIKQTNKWNDDNGHGTHVAGTIATLNNNIGVVGAAPDVSLYAVKVLTRDGSGYVSDIIAGIDWAVNNNMDIATMSLGGPGYSQAFQNAINGAHGSGVLIIAAAGNEGDGDTSTVETSYPAAYENVVAVAATDADDNLAWFSNSGNYVDIAAPGVNIRSTWNDGLYNTISGTSMACPHVTGVAALVLANNSSLSPDDVSSILTGTATDLGAEGFDIGYGNGLVNASAAVGAAS